MSDKIKEMRAKLEPQNQPFPPKSPIEFAKELLAAKNSMLNKPENVATHPGIPKRIWRTTSEAEVPSGYYVRHGKPVSAEKVALAKNWNSTSPSYWIELVPAAPLDGWILRKSWKFYKKDQQTGLKNLVEDKTESKNMSHDRACEKFLQAIANKMNDEYIVHDRVSKPYSPFFEVEIDPTKYTEDGKVSAPERTTLRRKSIW